MHSLSMASANGLEAESQASLLMRATCWSQPPLYPPVLPEPLEPLRAQLGVPNGVGNIPVSEVVLAGAGHVRLRGSVPPGYQGTSERHLRGTEPPGYRATDVGATRDGVCWGALICLVSSHDAHRRGETPESHGVSRAVRRDKQGPIGIPRGFRLKAL